MKTIDQLLVLQQYDMRKCELKAKILTEKNKISSIKQQKISSENLESECTEKIKQYLLNLNICQNSIKNVQNDIERFTKSNEQAKTISEIKASQTKIDQLQIQLQKLEEQAFEALCKVDEEQENLSKLRAATSNTTVKTHDEITKLESAIKDYEELLTKTDVKIEQLCENFDKKMLRIYRETVASVKKFPVVVKMIDEKCSGCNLKLSVGALSQILAKKDEIVHCEHCNRLLYTVGEEDLLEDDEDQF